MRKLRSKAWCSLIALTFSVAVHAVEVCPVTDTTSAAGSRLVYVNGIMNTELDSIASLSKIKSQLLESPNHTANKRSFAVHKVYNPIGWYGAEDSMGQWQDHTELFVLKTGEERYVVNLAKLAFSHAGVPQSIDRAAATEVSRYADNLLADEVPGNNELVRDGDVTTERMHESVCAIKALSDWMSTGVPTAIVAHSQGNLLANLAYAHAGNRLVQGAPNDVHKFVRLVNVGNTAQISLHGLNLTNADDDALYGLVSGLYNMADRYNWDRATSNCNNSDCDFIIDTATMGYPGGTDWYDHSFTEVYLSDREVEVNEFRGVNYTPGAKRFRDRFEDLVYAATSSLDAANPPPPPPVDPWTVVYRADFNGFTTDWAFTSAPVQYWSGGNLTFGAKANTTNSATATLNFPVGDGVHKMRIKWRQKISHGSGSYFKYLFDARGSGVNMAVVTDYCSSGNIAYVTNETCRTNQRPRGAIMNQWVNVVMIVSPGVVDVVITNDSGAQIDSFSDFGNHSPVLASPLFRIGGNDASTSLALDYFEIAIQNQ